MEESRLFELKDAIQSAAIVAGAIKEDFANKKEWDAGITFDGVQRQLNTLDGIVTSYIATHRMEKRGEL